LNTATSEQQEVESTTHEHRSAALHTAVRPQGNADLSILSIEPTGLYRAGTGPVWSGIVSSKSW
jgi:hypothetical protein